ncbi:hypothetical protein Sango_2670800 [Sesamum angolense]|uniref:Reverse transcriptase domain-containing protein n=1 Tax=Sesamum angolense TaxID=2727404 RepID=A0AAE1W2D7_9LAMI|nr:hypothetical protein Sango_2670800 [Sesamum angolense]
MRDDLLQPYTTSEVTKALFQMAPLKSPRADRMSPILFQKFWSIVNSDVIACVLNLLNSHVMAPNLNDTRLVLIPKCKHPEYLSQFQPISLCNVIYKIASKTIANRMKSILDRIISPSQSAFVPGRLISDNILLAFELNHFLNSKTRGKQGWMALKLDVSKAYDKVEWSFLEHHAEVEGSIQDIAMCRGTPSISHLLFANDILIFCQPSPHPPKKSVRCSTFTSQLHRFNLAMLAKQLWRIMIHPERLLSRVLKAQYFPSGDVLTAALGYRPSLTWRSIMEAHDLFHTGCRWREEDVLHTLVHCQFARQVWGLAPFHLPSILPGNGLVMQGNCLDPLQVVCFATKYLASFLFQNSDGAVKVSPLCSLIGQPFLELHKGQFSWRHLLEWPGNGSWSGSMGSFGRVYCLVVQTCSSIGHWGNGRSASSKRSDLIGPRERVASSDL